MTRNQTLLLAGALLVSALTAAWWNRYTFTNAAGAAYGYSGTTGNADNSGNNADSYLAITVFRQDHWTGRTAACSVVAHYMGCVTLFEAVDARKPTEKQP
jgi:hypothetical protein